MFKLRYLFHALAVCTLGLGASPVFGQDVKMPEGKEIYIPKDLRDNDFTDKDSKWSYHRMAWTDNVVLFWEKGFGDDLAKAPDLDGRPMTVDLHNLLDRIETFYKFFRDDLKFVLPGSKSEKYRMMVMLNYSLEGTAYGGDYDGVIGALWIAPNRVQDRKLNCIAHELGHSFQSQVMCDGTGEAWGGGGIFEMTSQWMLWQVNPQWVTDENYHWQAFRKSFHQRFLSGENIYRSPYVLEYWSTRHGNTVMGDLFRNGRRGEDPAQTYMRAFNLSLDGMADEMYECYSRLVTFDFPRVKGTCRKYTSELATTTTPAVTTGKVREAIRPVADETPGTYGFNVIELPLKAGKVQFRGLGDKARDGYRYGVVLVDAQNNPTYLPMQSAFSGKFSYRPAADTKHAYLVVVGCPADKYEPFTFNPYERNGEPAKERTYPYEITIK